MKDVWKQFSLYPVGCAPKFRPEQVLHTFLPKWLERTKPAYWHVLFEPQALVRFQSDSAEEAFDTARTMATGLGLRFEIGDCSPLNDGKWPSDLTGEDHDGGNFAGIGPVAARFVQASCELSLEIQKLDHVQQLEKTRQFLHLYLNTLGLNYLEESTVCRIYAERAIELTKKYYRM